MGNKLPQPPAHIQQTELRPQVHQAVAGGCAGQAHHARHPGPHPHQRPEPLGLIALERGQFVDHHHVVLKRQAALLDQPLHIFPVDDVDQRVLPKRRDALGFRSHRDRIRQALQVVPLLNLRGPGVPGHAQRRDHQHAAHLEALQHQFRDGGQGDDALAEAHLEQYGGDGVFDDEVRGVFLVVMWLIKHPAPLQSVPGCR